MALCGHGCRSFTPLCSLFQAPERAQALDPPRKEAPHDLLVVHTGGHKGEPRSDPRPHILLERSMLLGQVFGVGPPERSFAFQKPPAEVLESAELATLVRYTLAELSAEYQTLLMAKYVDGLTIEDIAEETNGSSEAVRSKLARARKAFRLAFKKLTHSTPGILEKSS